MHSKKLGLKKTKAMRAGADLGGRVGADLGGRVGADAFLFWGFAPLSNQRVHPLYYFEYPFWLTDPKSFLKAPSAQMFNNFEGKERAEKTQILGEERAGNLRGESAPEKRKCLKTPFDLFFDCGAENSDKTDWRSKKSLLKNFPKIRPPPSSRKS